MQNKHKSVHTSVSRLIQELHYILIDRLCYVDISESTYKKETGENFTGFGYSSTGLILRRHKIYHEGLLQDNCSEHQKQLFQ